MSATCLPFSRVFLVLLLVTTVVGSGCSRKKEKPKITGIAATVDVNNSSISVIAGPVAADGTSTADVTITFLDASGDPVAGVVPIFAATPTAGAVPGACPATDALGVSVCGLASTVAQSKTVSITFPIQKVGNAVVFEAGPAARLCIMTQPGGGVAGVAWPQQPVVQVGDVNCNLVSTAANNVTMVLAGSLGTLNGTATVAASSGVAIFSGLNINQAGSKVLTAQAAGLTGGTSSVFTITGGGPASLAFSQQPGGGATGVIWAQQPILNFLDVYGNLASSANNSVGLMVETGSGTLSGAVSRSAINGVVNFSGLSMTMIGAKTLRAVTLSGGTFNVVSNSFNITPGAPSKLAFVTQPGGGSIGAAWSQQPRVVVMDAQDNVIPTATNSITLQLIQGSGNLNGASTVSATAGTAVFAGLSIDQSGADKILRASSGALTVANSAPFAISSAPQLCWQASPVNAAAGAPFASQPVLFVSDNLCGSAMASATGTVSLSVGAGSGLLVGTTSVAVISGVSTFSGLSMQVAGVGKRLLGQYSGPAGAMAGTLSTSFDIYAGPAAGLIFARQPSSSGTAAQVFAVQPLVQTVDAYGNTLSSAATISINLANGTLGGTLTGAGTTVTSSGSVSYFNLSIDKSGIKNLRATLVPGTISVDSDPISISVGPAVSLAFVGAIGNAQGGEVLSPQPVVQVLDAGGNVVTSSNAPIGLSILSPGTGVISGNGTVSAASGVATFAGLSIDLIGSKQLVASSAGLSNGTSAVFNILQGPASRLCWEATPTNGTAGVAWSTQPRLIVADNGCNLISGASNSVSIVVASGGTISGSTTLAASNGTAAFSGLLWNQAGVKQIYAASSGLESGGTISFTIYPNSADRLVFSVQPSHGTATVALSQQPVVRVQDAFGNTVTSASHSVSLALSSGTMGTITGTDTLSASSGVASFSGLAFSQSGGKVLVASSSPALTQGTSSGFNISVGGPTQLSFTLQPGGGTAGVAWSQQPSLRVLDAGGNLVTSGSHNISLAVTTGTGTLSGSSSRFTSMGTVAFSGLSMTVAGNNKVITASSAGLTSAVSAPAFVITPNVPSASVSTFAGSPTTIFARGTVASSILSGVLVDAYSNPIAGRSVNASSSLVSTIFTGGTTSVTNASGQFTFTVSSGTVGVGTITASIPTDSVTLTQRPVITFESYVAALANSSWSFAPVTVAANGSSTATLNVVLRNNIGTVLPGKTVTLVSSRGGSDTITTSPSSTNGSGAVTMTVRSSTRGEPTFTIASSGDSLNLTNNGRLLFYDIAPVADWQAQLANSSAASMGPGLNSPATTIWKDLFNLGPNDGALTNFGMTTTSGWCGSGTGTVGTCATGAYRLVLDGANDYVNFGTGLNSFANRTHELWMRTVTPLDRGEVVLSNGDTSNRGLTIRQAWDASGDIELTAGESRSYPGEVWADAPIGYYRFDSGAGVTTGTANFGTNLTYSNMGTTGVVGGIQDPGTSIYLNGTNSYGDAGNVYPATINMTISAMIYTGSLTGVRTIASKGNASTGYALDLNAGRLRMRSRNGAAATQIVTGATTLVANTWYHVAGVRDATNLTMKVYVNGVEDGSIAVTNTVTTLTTSFAVGRNSAGSYFLGRIDELAIYNTALSPARIAAQAAARNQQTCYSTTVFTAGVWRQIVATFDDTSKNMSLYVNGNLECTRASTGYSVGSSVYPLAAGARVDDLNASSAPYFNGMLGDVRIYDQTLNGTQIMNNYNVTSPRFP